MKAPREYRLTEGAVGLTFQESPGEFLRIEIYPDYFGVTWSTRWTPQEYGACAMHVLTHETNGKRSPSLELSRRSSDVTVQERDSVSDALEDLESTLEPTEFVKLTAYSKKLGDMALSWQSTLPSRRLDGASVGFVGTRFSSDYMEKLISNSATEMIGSSASEIINKIWNRLPTDVRCAEPHS